MSVKVTLTSARCDTSDSPYRPVLSSSSLLLARLINRQVEVSVGAVHNDSTVSVVGFEVQSKRWWVL